MSIEETKKTLHRWRTNPLEMVTQGFNCQNLESVQLEFFKVLPDPNLSRIALKACKGVGKTFCEALAIIWFMGCMGEEGNHPKGLATAISESNIDDNLWPEIAKWNKRQGWFARNFTWTKTRYFSNSHPDTWFFSKRAWPKSGDPQQQADSLAGVHGKYVLFIIDESGGVPVGVLSSAEGILSTRKAGHWAKIIQGGNPTHRSGALYEATVTNRQNWYVINITGDPENPKRSSRQSLDWAKLQVQTYGRDNPWVKINVLGEFPDQDMNSLLGPEEVLAAMSRGIQEDQFSWAQKRLGIDVARFGDDRTVIFPRQGLIAYKPVEMRGARTTEIAARVLEAKNSWGSECEIIDDTGHWGHGVIDCLLAAGHSAHGVQFHGPPHSLRFKNRRAEMWIRMRDWIRRGGCLPNIPSLVAELTTPTYTCTLDGKLQLEAKDQVKIRLGRSPDLADALALTFALPEAHTGALALPFMDRPGHADCEYDPFSDERMKREFDV